MTNTLLNSHWQHLVSLATLGLARQAIKPNEFWPNLLEGTKSIELAAVINETNQSAATQILRATAATQLSMMAGQRAAPTEFQAPPVDISDDCYCSDTACWQLMRILTGDMHFLATEWCDIAVKTRQMIAPHWLPSILLANKKYHATLSPALGSRNLWFIKIIPSLGAFAALANDQPVEQVWPQATNAERELLLRSLRSTKPELARQLVESTWGEDSADIRATFLEILAPSISAEDESLFERALSDKRKTVRRPAVEGLSRLATSAYHQRMLQRVAPLLTFDSNAKSGLLGMKRRAVLNVTLPTALEAESVRDGIEEKPPAHRKIGDRSYWLLQMLSTIDPDAWCKRFDTQIETLFGAMTASEEASLLLEAIVNATIKHRNAAWAKNLAEWWVTSATEEQRRLTTLPDLLNCIDAEWRQRVVLDLLKQSQATIDLCFVILNSAQLPWSQELTGTAFRALVKAINSEKRPYALARDILQSWSEHCDIDTAVAHVAQLTDLGDQSSSWKNAIQRFADIIECRRALRAELKATASPSTTT